MNAKSVKNLSKAFASLGTVTLGHCDCCGEVRTVAQLRAFNNHCKPCYEAQRQITWN